MTDETGKEVTERASGAVGTSPRPVGEGLVGRTGIILITIYLVLLSVALIYGLVQFWLSAVLAEQAVTLATFLIWKFSISGEVHLMLIVVLAGALGGQVHALRSLYWYVGSRKLVRSWLLFYFLRPFVGATLALVFYFVVRAGFFSPGSTVQQTSVYGFTALAALVGIFSEQAVLKLKEVAETLFAKPKPGEDSKPQE